MNLGIIAHNSKKVLIEDFCIAYKHILAKHEVYATGTTGRRIEMQRGFTCHKFWPAASAVTSSLWTWWRERIWIW